MNHSWKEIEPNSLGKVYKCKTCGCLKHGLMHGKWQHSRSGQLFGYNNRPDCINWEVENSKTID